MDFVAEFFAELFFDIFGEVFMETTGGMTESRYVPKWLRVLIITVVFALMAFIVAVVFGNNNMALAVFEGIVAVGYIILLVKSLMIKTKRFECIDIDENRRFVGKRTVLGTVNGGMDLSNLGCWTEGVESVYVRFEKDDSFPRRARVAAIDESEIEFMTDICGEDELSFNHVGSRAKEELAKKLKNKVQANSGKGLRLIGINFSEGEIFVEKVYIFKDSVSGKKVRVTDSEEKAMWHVKKSQ